MVSLEEIERDYELFDETDEKNLSKEECTRYLEQICRVLKSRDKDIKWSIFSNNFQRKIFIIGAFVGYYDSPYKWVFDADGKILEEELDVNNLFYEYFNILPRIINENNVDAVYKLTVFTEKYCEQNYFAFGNKRKDLECQYNGVACEGIPCDTTYEIYRKFFEQELLNVSLIKPVEKVKKI